MGAPRVFGASVVGDAHTRVGFDCQDAFRAMTRGDRLAVAVADGLGTARRSDEGAAIATEAAVARALDVDAADPCRSALEAAVAARDALESLACVEDEDLAVFACTLIVAVVAERVGIAHIGDGVVVGVAGDEPHVLSPPARSEYVNEVDPLTSADWVDRVAVTQAVDGVDAIGLLTDGCQHAAVRRDNGHYRAHAGFFAPLVRYARSGVGTEEGSLAIARLLSGPKICEHSDDDKTLVLAVLR